MRNESISLKYEPIYNRLYPTLGDLEDQLLVLNPERIIWKAIKAFSLKNSSSQGQNLAVTGLFVPSSLWTP